MVEVKETVKAEKVQSFLDEGDTREFRKFYLEMHPYDQAVFFKDQSDENRLKIYSYLSPKEMSVIMENVEIKESEKFITEMDPRSEEHTSELQSRGHIVCRLLLEKKKIRNVA